ncbi:MAG TPA: GNAT family N-acetyltransferase [Tepidisphaeraceae bacterium]|jgi:GNAT superfamily N-acetyltransferase|nr:GNAT family N-acetyltransferase [Tepidisphaeraceae bacterium]
MSAIKIERVDVEQVVDLRLAVLRAGLPREAAKFPGDDDPQTVHLAAKEGGNVIACATILVNEWNGQRACQLRGMAVDPAYQRRGVGRQILTEVDRVAAEKGVRILWANARKPAAEFYRKYGWEIVSEEFEIPTAGPHFKMVRIPRQAGG